MKIEAFARARREPDRWISFMEDLEARIHRGRRRAWAAGAAAALFLLFVGVWWRLPGPLPPASTVRAEVPSASAPLFVPSHGSAFTASGSVVILYTENRT